LSAQPELLQADWPAPPAVRTAVSLRTGGVSTGGYASLNLADHVGDEQAHVGENRRRLRVALDLPAEPHWLRQVHGTRVIKLSSEAGQDEADAAWTAERGVVCAILSADCLPVLFCDREGSVVAAAHAGWRGLAAGVLEATLRALPAAPSSMLAWLGPAIGPAAFEVGAEVRDAFIAQDAQCTRHFVRSGAEKFSADLFGLARQRLHGAGVSAVYGGGRCTHADPQRFYSYRRDRVCGRMVSLIWLL